MIYVDDSGRQVRPRPEPDPLTGAISASGDTQASAAAGGSQRRAIYKWQAQTTADGSQSIRLKAGATTIDGIVAAKEGAGKICEQCWYEIEPDEAIIINTSTAIGVRYFIWVTNI